MKRFVGETEPSTLCDRIAILARLSCLVGAFVCAVIVASIFRSLQGEASCFLSHSFSGSARPSLSFGDPWPCKTVFIAACVVSALMGFFALMCLRNLCQNKIRPHVSLSAKVHHFLVVAVFLAVVCSAILTTTRLEDVCDQATSARGYRVATCATALADLGQAWCSGCAPADYSTQYSHAQTARNALWAAVGFLCVVLVLVLVRHVRTQQEVERQRQEEEARSQREQKQKEADAKDETKGFVYRLLL